MMHNLKTAAGGPWFTGPGRSRAVPAHRGRAGLPGPVGDSMVAGGSWADVDEIGVGPECNIQDQCCLHVDAGEPVILAERVSLGHRAMVHGAHVEAGALIGIGAIVLGRARIGAGSLVAAGTVVRPGQQIPPGVLVAGVPGRVVRELTDADRATFADTAAQYIRRAARHDRANWTGPGDPAGR